MAAIWGMTTRRRPVGVLGPGHAVTRYEAARLHTADAARFAGNGRIRGTLALGKLADFAAYPTEPLTCPVDERRGLSPVLTVVGGRPRHDPRGLLGGSDHPARASTGKPGVPAIALPCC